MGPAHRKTSKKCRLQAIYWPDIMLHYIMLGHLKQQEGFKSNEMWHLTEGEGKEAKSFGKTETTP